MTFEAWWKLLKPAECDEVKPQFEECWQQAYAAGRESMREECLQECSAEATDNGTAQRIEKAIEGIK